MAKPEGDGQLEDQSWWPRLQKSRCGHSLYLSFVILFFSPPLPSPRAKINKFGSRRPGTTTKSARLFPLFRVEKRPHPVSASVDLVNAKHMFASGFYDHTLHSVGQPERLRIFQGPVFFFQVLALLGVPSSLALRLAVAILAQAILAQDWGHSLSSLKPHLAVLFCAVGKGPL